MLLTLQRDEAMSDQPLIYLAGAAPGDRLPETRDVGAGAHAPRHGLDRVRPSESALLIRLRRNGRWAPEDRCRGLGHLDEEEGDGPRARRTGRAPPGKNQLGVLPGSVETAPSQEPWYVPETWMTRLQAGRSFTCRARSCVSTRTCRRRLSCSRWRLRASAR